MVLLSSEVMLHMQNQVNIFDDSILKKCNFWYFIHLNVLDNYLNYTLRGNLRIIK